MKAREVLSSRFVALVTAICLITVFAPAAATGLQTDEASATPGCDESIETETELSDALGNADPGATICVEGDIVLEENVVLDTEGLHLMGIDEPTLTYDTGEDGATATHTALDIRANDVTVSGLEIVRAMDGDTEDPLERWGTDARHGQAVRVGGQTSPGISSITITDNTITFDGTPHADIMVHGVGILDADQADTQDVTVEDNRIEGFDLGVSAADGAIAYGNNVTGVTVHQNTFVDNEVSIMNAASSVLEATFNWYATPAGPLAEQPVAGAVVFTPWCVDEDCTTETTLQEDQSLVEVTKPENGDAFAPGADIEVTWDALADDFGFAETYRVELIGQSEETNHQRSVIQYTNEDSCTPHGLDLFECEATLEDVPEGEFSILVRPTATNEELLTELAAMVCYQGVDAVCDSVTSLDVGFITEIDAEPDGVLDDEWVNEPAEVTLSCKDSVDACTIKYDVHDAEDEHGDFRTTEDETTFTVSDEGQAVTWLGVDQDGNEEQERTETVLVDLSTPSTELITDPEEPKDHGWFTEPVDVDFETGADCADNSPCTTYAELNGEEMDIPFTVSEDGEHELTYWTEDEAGNVEDAITETLRVATNPVIDLTLEGGHDTYVPNGDSVNVVYEAQWQGGPNDGEAADGETVKLTSTDGEIEEEATTNADGFVQFTLDDEDAERTLEATIIDPTDEAEVLEPDSTTITWTDLTIQRAADEDVTDATPGWADAGATYRLGYEVTQTVDGAPVADAKVELDSGDFSTTDEDGIALVPVTQTDPAEITFEATAEYAPDEGPTQTAGGAEEATVRWANVVYSDLTPDAGEGTEWYDAGDEVPFSFTAEIDFGADKIPAEGADVTIEAPSETSDEDETTAVTVGPDGTAQTSLHFENNAKTAPALTLESTPQGISVQDDAGFGDQRWATLVVDEFAVLTDTGYEETWHAVGDEVTFEFSANLQFGDDRETDVTPAEGTQLDFVLDEASTLTVGETGDESITRTFEDPFEETPVVELVSTPEGVTETSIEAFDEQRWTEVSLEASGYDAFVNVGDEVTFGLDASWAHDGSSVNGALVEILDADAEVLQTCESFDGETACSLTREDVYADDLTFVVQETDVGITQQTDDEPLAVGMVWTEIVVDDVSADDGFVGVGEPITLTGQATYAHDGEPVPDAGLALGEDAPDACSLGAGTVEEGALEAVVECSEVTDDRIPLVVASGHEEVTLLSDELELYDTDRDTNAVWTGFEVTYETLDEDGEPIEDDSLLDHNKPVVFEGTVQFAHMDTDGDATEPPTESAEFQVLKDGETETTCINEIGDDGTASCVTEIREDAGEHTYSVGAASFDQDEDGYFARDVEHVVNEPEDSTYRWTSIAFEEFECHGSVSGAEDCDYAWDVAEQVTVTATAIAADEPGEPLENATITIDGNQKDTGEDGQASHSFLSFEPDCRDVTAAGVEATIAGQTVTWDTPRTQQICWG